MVVGEGVPNMGNMFQLGNTIEKNDICIQRIFIMDMMRMTMGDALCGDSKELKGIFITVRVVGKDQGIYYIGGGKLECIQD